MVAAAVEVGGRPDAAGERRRGRGVEADADAGVSEGDHFEGSSVRRGTSSAGMPSSSKSFLCAAFLAPRAFSAMSSDSRYNGWLQQVFVHTRGNVTFVAERC